MDSTTFRASATDAVRFWERGRILYNLALVAVVGAVFGHFWPLSRQALSLDLALGLFELAVLANVLYCSAYVVDLFLQYAGFAAGWRRRRWMLWTLGTAFACVLTQFIARGMFAAPH